MSEDGVTQSRFYMWRAIFAIAHVDGKIDKKEEAFMDEHMRKVPFSMPQKAVLEDDIIHPKDPAEMLARVTSHEDQGMFFQFARMMCWSDGNYAVQEKEIMERLLGAHMEQLDIEGLTGALQESRDKAAKRYEKEQEADQRSAQRKTGIGKIIANFMAPDRPLCVEGVTDSRFFMWRAIFAMAHADHEVTKEERDFMYDVLDSEPFSDAQREALERDMDAPQDVGELFMKIADQEDRSQFFYFARMLCWSDGNFDEQEQEVILKLKKIHVQNIDFDRVLASVDLQLDETEKEIMREDMGSDNPFKNAWNRFRSSR